MENRHRGTTNPRTLISYLFLSVLFGLSAKNATEGAVSIVKDHGFRSDIVLWGLAITFFVTATRFLMGNILHMHSLEVQSSIPALTWLMDFLVTVVEGLLFLMMSLFIYPASVYFLWLLFVICLLDSLWILSMFPLRKFRKAKVVPVWWAILNLFSALYLGLLVSGRLWLAPLDTLAVSITVGFFVMAAFVDVYLVDYYGLLK